MAISLRHDCIFILVCGIVGYLNFNPGLPIHSKLDRLAKMPLKLTHRGPENLGLWHDKYIFLSQTRLKILDLSEKSNQPIFNEDKSIVLVFNGEIYNYKELRDYLLKQGHSFSSNGDSETIIHLYEEFGDTFIQKLDGMFAFALWDQKKERLLLARDRTGKKPLFYYRGANFLAFASEIKAFFPLSEIRIEKNERLFPYYFIYGNIPSPDTFYKNIYSLEPAHYLIVEREKSIVKRQYWDLQHFFKAKNDKTTEADAKEAITSLLKNAVAKRLISDVPLGVFLSGGIDSTIITGIITKELHRPLKTFSIGFEKDKTYDETSYADIAVRHFQTDHIEYHVHPQAVVDTFDKLLYHYDGPFGDSSCIPTSIVAQLAKQEVTVVLTGDGGDEVFGGYNRFLASLLLSRIPKVLNHIGDHSIKLMLSPFKNKSTGKLHQIRRFMEAARLSDADRLTKWTSYFYSDIRDLLNKDFRSQLSFTTNFHYLPYLDAIKDMTPLSKLLYLNLKTYLSDDLNIKMDRATMMHSLEARAPFLDHHLIEYCATLPDHFLIKWFDKKHILKETYKKILPTEIYRRRKAGFGVPLGKWFRGPLKSFILDEFHSLKDIDPYVNPTYVNALLKSHFEGLDHSLKLWNLLMFKKWVESVDSWTRDTHP